MAAQKSAYSVKVLEAYRRGLSVREISEELKVSDPTVRGILRREGLEVNVGSARILTEVRKNRQAVIEMLNGNEFTFEEIVELSGVNRGTVLQVVRDYKTKRGRPYTREELVRYAEELHEETTSIAFMRRFDIDLETTNSLGFKFFAPTEGKNIKDKRGSLTGKEMYQILAFWRKGWEPEKLAEFFNCCIDEIKMILVGEDREFVPQENSKGYSLLLDC